MLVLSSSASNARDRRTRVGSMIGDEIVNRWGKLLQERSDTLAEADKDGAQRYPSVAIMQSTLFAIYAEEM